MGSGSGLAITARNFMNHLNKVRIVFNLYTVLPSILMGGIRVVWCLARPVRVSYLSLAREHSRLPLRVVESVLSPRFKLGDCVFGGCL